MNHGRAAVLVSMMFAMGYANGCGATSSEYMVPAATPVAEPVADKATILFTADIAVDLGGSDTITVYDENKRFVGQLFEHSMFEASFPAGHHGFAAVSFWVANHNAKGNEKFDCGLSFTADLEAGKVYIAWLRVERDGGEMGKTRWVFLRPGMKLMDPARSLKTWSGDGPNAAPPGAKPVLVPNLTKGQSYLESFGARLCTPTTEAGPKGFDLPADYGFEHLPR
jgi:hypothetical protein